jgi:aspartate-semialdehyde dehydrogenase
MVVGQDLGITLDMETWWMKATAKHIAQTTDTMVTAVAVAVAVAEGDDGGVVVALQQHTTGQEAERRVDWVVCATPPRPADALWRALRDQGQTEVEVHRVGDCVSPRRAHAAVIEGERVGASL